MKKVFIVKPKHSKDKKKAMVMSRALIELLEELNEEWKKRLIEYNKHKYRGR